MRPAAGFLQKDTIETEGWLVLYKTGKGRCEPGDCISRKGVIFAVVMLRHVKSGSLQLLIGKGRSPFEVRNSPLCLAVIFLCGYFGYRNASQATASLIRYCRYCKAFLEALNFVGVEFW